MAVRSGRELIPILGLSVGCLSGTKETSRGEVGKKKAGGDRLGRGIQKRC